MALPPSRRFFPEALRRFRCSPGRILVALLIPFYFASSPAADTPSPNPPHPLFLQGKVESVMDDRRCSVVLTLQVPAQGNAQAKPVNSGIIGTYNRVILYTREPVTEGQPLSVQVYDAGIEEIGSHALHRYDTDPAGAEGLRQEGDPLADKPPSSPAPAASPPSPPSTTSMTSIPLQSFVAQKPGIVVVTQTLPEAPPEALTTESGRYKAKVYHTVGLRWFANVEQLLQFLQPGSVVVTIAIRKDGMYDATVKDTDGDSPTLLRSVSLTSIKDAAPFDTFTDTLRKEVGESLTVEYTFTIPGA